jgi:hypothetical protein
MPDFSFTSLGRSPANIQPLSGVLKENTVLAFQHFISYARFSKHYAGFPGFFAGFTQNFSKTSAKNVR